MIGKTLFAACTMMVVAVLATGIVEAGTPTNVNGEGVAVKGYDAVAFFTLGRAVPGSREFAFEWNEATWWFSTKSHLELFTADPAKYAPQYGGY